MMTLIRTRSKDTNAVSSMRKVFARLRKWRSIRMLFPFLSEKGGMRIHMNSCEYLSVALNRGSVQSASIVETPSGGLGVTFLIPNVGDRRDVPRFSLCASRLLFQLPNPRLQELPPLRQFLRRRHLVRESVSLESLPLCAQCAAPPYELTEQCVRRSKDTPLLSAICRA